MEDVFTIANKNFKSRLIVGTGKYKNFEERKWNSLSLFFNFDRFDITRKTNKHLSFGAGPHYCVGAPLSRLEAQLAILTFIDRLPNLRLAADDSPELSSNNFFRGRTRITLEFD